MTISAINEFTPWEQCRAAQMDQALLAARRAASLPAYTREWGERGLVFDDIDMRSWARVPTLTKDALVEGATSAGPFGGRLGVDPKELAHVFVAPGPLYMPFTAADFNGVVRSFAKAIASCGLGPGDIVDQTTMYNWVIAATVMDKALASLGCCTVPGGVGQSERHLEVIEQLGVTAVLAFPSFLEHLLELAAKAGRPLPLRKAAVMGELRDPDAKQRMQRDFGIKVREFYGVADVGAVAWECEAGEGMHLRDDLLVEFIAPGRDELVTPTPGQPAEIVVTDLQRTAMPIIRLRTGDTVSDLLTAPCRCGRTSPRFTRIVGRASEITKVKGMFVVPRTVEDLLRREGMDRLFRLVVELDEGGRDALSLEVEGAEPADVPDFQSKVEHALRLRLKVRYSVELPQGGPRLVDRRFGSVK